MNSHFRILPLLLALAPFSTAADAPTPQPRTVTDGPALSDTVRLETRGDIASELVAGADAFLLRKLEESQSRRAQFWNRDFSSPAAYARSVETNRSRLMHILGVRDARRDDSSFQLSGPIRQPALAARGSSYDIFAVRWPAFADVEGEGFVLVPRGREPVADIILIPDASQTPEQLAGLAPSSPGVIEGALRFAGSGCRVIIPAVIDRETKRRNGRAELTTREFLYRPAFELGRQLIGYETQKILAAADICARESGHSETGPRPLAVMGWGEGGLLALYAAALDPRITAAFVSGYFDDRRQLWQEPIDRNIFGLLEQFGDAELATLVAPRRLIIEAARGPEAVFAGKGGAPSRLVSPSLERVAAEVSRARDLVSGLQAAWQPELIVTGEGQGSCGSEEALDALRAALGLAVLMPLSEKPAPVAPLPDPGARMARQVHQIDRHNQTLLAESPYVRQKFMENLKFDSEEAFLNSAAPYREIFETEIIGKFDDELLPAAPRSRQIYDAERWRGYEVVLDVYPDVIAYGILLIPKDIKPGERRPVVVCQHGLEGRPRQTIENGDGYAYYKAFAAQLADRGFITFAPQNLYLFGDRFRTLQRKANPLKKTLFSIITPQHRQIVRWLQTRPEVDPDKIAFYGLSYGGKTAMRVPALVPEYCLSICSADFNEWVWKNASTRSPYSYVWTGEYEIFEFDLGSTFNYAEMAALIAPRPFMVERGHFDGVAPDEAVGHEFAKVRFLYQAKLGLGERCRIEWFSGPHSIHGKGTFDFLEEHLRPAR